MPELQGDFILAGDIGGTKTNLGIYSRGPRSPVLKDFKTYPSAMYPDMESIVEEFIKGCDVSVQCACFGIAGPVHQGRCSVTNLPWEVRESSLKRRFRLKRVELINDLTATALAVPFFKKNELHVLNRGRAQKHGHLALIAPGTGLGESIVVFEAGRYIPVPSEGGHVDFAANNETEIGLWRYLKLKYGHVSLERILTGQGLADIHSFLTDSGAYHMDERIMEAMKGADPAAIISREAINGRIKSCRAALDIFVSILGAAAGNLALTGMATGGVYIGGGISPRILPRLRGRTFLRSFMDKGRFKGLLEKMPVYVILNDKAALMGAAARAFEIIESFIRASV